MNSLILTAGKGTRFKPHTDSLAKPAIEFLSLPMMMYSRYYAEECLGSKTVIFNLHHLPKTIKAVNNSFNGSEASLLYSDETSKLLDSGGGIKQAVNQHFKNDKSVFISNGDNICIIKPEDLKKSLQLHNENDNDLTILVGRHSEAGSTLSALYADQDLNLKDKGIEKSSKLQPYHYLGMMFLNSRLLKLMPEGAFSLFDDGLLPQLTKLKIKLYVVDQYLWFETGNPKDFLEATKECLNHIRQQTEFGKQLEKMIKTYRSNVDFKFSDSHQIVTCSPEALKNNSIEGFAVIGSNCSISNCHLNNCVVQSNAHISQKDITNSFVLK